MTISMRDNAFAGFKLWYYDPSIAAAVIFTILFILLTAYHTFLLARRRTWFCIPFVVGGLFECIGYIARALAHSNMESVGIYTAQSITLLLAPILFAASVYMILGRIIRLTNGEQYSFIRVNWLTKIFVCGDVFCFMMQGAGGGLLATSKTKSAVDTANNVILGGLILQIIIFCVFLVTAFLFQRRMSQHPTIAALDGPLGTSRGKSSVVGALTWRKFMMALYATSVLITLRNLFRVIEYGMGWGSYLLANEWPLYLFDGLLMVMVLAIGILWYNPDISHGNKKGMQSYNMTIEHRAAVPKSDHTGTNSSQPWS